MRAGSWRDKNNAFVRSGEGEAEFRRIFGGLGGEAGERGLVR